MHWVSPESTWLHVQLFCKNPENSINCFPAKPQMVLIYDGSTDDCSTWQWCKSEKHSVGTVQLTREEWGVRGTNPCAVKNPRVTFDSSNTLHSALCVLRFSQLWTENSIFNPWHGILTGECENAVLGVESMDAKPRDTKDLLYLLKKNPHISGPLQFTPAWFKGHLFSSSDLFPE